MQYVKELFSMGNVLTSSQLKAISANSTVSTVKKAISHIVKDGRESLKIGTRLLSTTVSFN
jgi:hypothetical protein